ncbi:hypothetical protein IT417_02710 [bacterium]|nr:hypothetical protein [bacterium]
MTTRTYFKGQENLPYLFQGEPFKFTDQISAEFNEFMNEGFSKVYDNLVKVGGKGTEDDSYIRVITFKQKLLEGKTDLSPTGSLMQEAFLFQEYLKNLDENKRISGSSEVILRHVNDPFYARRELLNSALTAELLSIQGGARKGASKHFGRLKVGLSLVLYECISVVNSNTNITKDDLARIAVVMSVVNFLQLREEGFDKSNVASTLQYRNLGIWINIAKECLKKE